MKSLKLKGVVLTEPGFPPGDEDPHGPFPLVGVREPWIGKEERAAKNPAESRSANGLAPTTAFLGLGEGGGGRS